MKSSGILTLAVLGGAAYLIMKSLGSSSTSGGTTASPYGAAAPSGITEIGKKVNDILASGISSGSNMSIPDILRGVSGTPISHNVEFKSNWVNRAPLTYSTKTNTYWVTDAYSGRLSAPGQGFNPTGILGDSQVPMTNPNSVGGVNKFYSQYKPIAQAAPDVGDVIMKQNYSKHIALAWGQMQPFQQAKYGSIAAFDAAQRAAQGI